VLFELWRRFGALPQWQQAVGSAGVLVVLWLVVRGARTVLAGGGRPVLTPTELRERGRALEGADPADDNTASSAAADDERATSWTNERPLCACCGYPTDVDAEALGCAICDWMEPDVDDSLLDDYSYNLVPQPVEIDLSSPERSAPLGELSDRAIDLRRQLRERFDYLRGNDPLDLSEQWDKVDELMAELRAELESR